MTTSSSRRGGTARYGERTCRRRWWLWLWTFARGGERSKSGVGASTRRSGSPATPAPLIAAAVAAAPTLAALPCRVVTRGEGTRIEDPSHQDRAGRGHMSLNPISSQSLPVLFIYLFTRSACVHRQLLRAIARKTTEEMHPSCLAAEGDSTPLRSEIKL